IPSRRAAPRQSACATPRSRPTSGVGGVVGLARDHLPRLLVLEALVRMLGLGVLLHLAEQLLVGRSRQRLATDVALDDSLGHDLLASSWAVSASPPPGPA